MTSFRTIHRTISLAIAFVWFFQLASGLLLIFSRDIDDISFPPANGEADFAAIEAGLQLVLAENPGSSIPYVYTFDSHFNRFDVYVAAPDGDYSVLRMDSDGTVLRALPSNPEVFDAGFFEILLELHEKLWAGSTGHAFVGISGILLVTNMLFGLKMAWPRKGMWRQAIKIPAKRSGAAGTYSMHRFLGLVFGVPAVFLIGAGTLIVYEDPIADLLGVESISPNIEAVERLPAQFVQLPKAIATAKAQFPGAHVSVFTLPSAAKPYYRIRLLQEAELRRYYGKTTVYVSALNGGVIATEDALVQPLSARFINAFYPVHSGGAFGPAGKVINLILGLWLLAMMVYGIRLWWLRR